jgi:phospholipid transport system transporter-binding protein
MIRREGERMVVSGALTLANVAAELRQGNAAIGGGVRTVDLAEGGELDSSALALLLAWLREAKRQNRSLTFANLPQGLTTIARLYGVAELLPTTSAAVPAHH